MLSRYNAYKNNTGSTYETPSGNGGGSGSGGGASNAEVNALKRMITKHIQEGEPPHITKATLEKIDKSITNKDIVIKANTDGLSIDGNSGETIVLYDTEFLFPYIGDITSVICTLAKKDGMNTNLLLTVEREISTNNWDTIQDINIGISQYEKEYKLSRPYRLNNTRVRLKLQAGNFSPIEGLTVILKVTNIKNK